jgi:hypothetical protein
MPGRTARYYQENPEARKKRLEYQSEYNKRPSEVNKRERLNSINRRRGTYGNGDGMDASHTKRGIIMKRASLNRGDVNDTPGDKRARGKKK